MTAVLQEQGHPGAKAFITIGATCVPNIPLDINAVPKPLHFQAKQNKN